MKTAIVALVYLVFVICAWQYGVAPVNAQDTESAAAIAKVAQPFFPREVSSDAGTVVIHTPQVDTWKDFKSIEARLAVEVTPAGEDEPVYGVAEFTADTDPNLELRVVAIENAVITVTSFPVADDARREKLDSIVRTTIEPKTQFISLDVMLSYIAPDAKMPEAEGLSLDPPPIFYSSTPDLTTLNQLRLLRK